MKVPLTPAERAALRHRYDAEPRDLFEADFTEIELRVLADAAMRGVRQPHFRVVILTAPRQASGAPHRTVRPETFPSRRTARRWLRRHVRALGPNLGLRILHPDGAEEEFTWST